VAPSLPPLDLPGEPEFRADLSPLYGQPVRVAIVVSRYNQRFTTGLLEGALAELHTVTGGAGIADGVWVPGAFEIPQAVSRVLSHSNKEKVWGYRGVLALGCLIEGETDHYRILCDEVVRRLGELSVDQDIPLSFGILTCRTLEQAHARTMPGPLNKGAECMRALLEMTMLELP
jgi:6,7-dimethyl-8-ribityllumazine synthase